MALQFNPDPYWQAYLLNQQNQTAEKQKPMQFFQNMNKTSGDIASMMTEMRKQQLINQLAREKASQDKTIFETEYGKQVPGYTIPGQVTPSYMQGLGMNDLGGLTPDRRITEALTGSPRPYFVPIFNQNAQQPLDMMRQRTMPPMEGRTYIPEQQGAPTVVPSRWEPGLKQKQFDADVEERRLKREELNAQRDFNRNMSLDRFDLQKEVFGLKQEQEAAKVDAARKAEEALRQSRMGEANDIITSIDDALKKVDWTSTGAVGSMMGKFSGSKAVDLSGDLDHINSILGLSKLADMKSQSKAGASGMGQLSDREMTLLIAAVKSLKQSQGTGQVRENLIKVRDHYNNWLQMENGINPYEGGGQPNIGVPNPSPSPSQPRKSATNPQTGQKIYSDDGGLTWHQ